MSSSSIRERRRAGKHLILIVLLAWAWSSSAPAEEASDAARYHACMSMIDTDAEAAFDTAIEWQGLGGGSAAKHCVAAALMALGYFDQAAERLENLAQDPVLDGSLKPEILRQAAQGWLSGGDAERAYAVLTSAIELEPSHSALWLDRGIVAAEIGLYDDAVTDLSRALTLEPSNPQAWLLRGSAYRMLDKRTEAARDVEEALRLDPESPEAYLERGNLRRLEGDDSGARRDWIEVITRAPQSAEADAARTNIERLDLGDGAQ
ncbi:MAG: tetratricopeptide repeat protein [Rhodospirillales bacterium]